MKKGIFALVCFLYVDFTSAFSNNCSPVRGEGTGYLPSYNLVFETPTFFSYIYPINLAPNRVIVPRVHSGFLFGLTGYSLRALDNQLDWVIPDPLAALSFQPSPLSTIQSVDPNRKFSRGAYLGYLCPSSGREIKLDFSDFRSNLTDTATPPGIPGIGGLWIPIDLYDRGAIAFAPSSASAKIQFHQASLMLGQRLAAGAYFSLTPAIGLKHASIQRNLTSFFNMNQTGTEQGTVTSNSMVQEKSRFNGVGPGFQFNAAYFIAPHLGLIAHLTNAILLGTIKSQKYQSEIVIDNGIEIADETVINLKGTKRAVVNTEGKLGLFFDYPICGSKTKLDFELGYEFNHFFNAIDTYRSAGAVHILIADEILGVDSFTFSDTPLHVKDTHDLSADGPYLSIGISGLGGQACKAFDPVCISMPKLNGGFTFALGYNYYQLQQIHRDYALADPNPIIINERSPFPPVIVPSTNSTLQTIEGHHADSFEADVGYVFDCSPYDLSIHYEQSNTHNSDMVDSNKNSVSWPILAIPYFTSYETRAFAEGANATLSFDYNESHIELGQVINAEGLACFRLFEGIEYARIKSNLQATYTNLQTIPPIGLEPIDFVSEQVQQNSKFSGIGPRVGINMNLPMGFLSLTSEFAGGFMLGKISSNYTDNISPGNLTVVGAEEIAIPAASLGTNLSSEDQFSPFLELKLALAYSWNICGKTSCNVELGYKAAHYFDTLATFRHATNNAAIFIKQISDVTLDGPYVNISFYCLNNCFENCCPRTPYCAYVPEFKGGFEFAIEGLYLRAHVPNTDYCIVDPSPEFIPNVPLALGAPLVASIPLNPSAKSQVQVLSPDFNRGYRIHLGYVLPLTANDISINYTYFDESTSEKAVAPLGGVIWTMTNGSYGAVSTVLPSLFPVFANQAQASADFKWQTASLEFGRRIKLHHLMTRFFAGLTWAKISEKVNIVYQDGVANNVEFTPVPFDIVTQDSDFLGVGPRLGFSGDFNFGCGFSLIGSVATDLLVGKNDSSLFELSSSGDTAVLDPDRRTRLIPAVDAKFGLAYSLPLMNYCHQFGIEFGYEVNHYFNVKDSLRFTDYFASFIKQNQNISFDGPYIKLQFEF